MQQVSLKDVRFYAFHGYFPEEQILGNEFFVSVDVTIYQVSGAEDQLQRTIDYQQLYELVASEMNKPRKLLETVAEHVISETQKVFPQVEEVHVKIVKSNPPFGGDAAHAAVDLYWSRNNVI